MKKLFFVRHGETQMNVAGLLSGQTETPLTSSGKQQAKKLKCQYRSIPELHYDFDDNQDSHVVV